VYFKIIFLRKILNLKIFLKAKNL